MGYQVAVTPLQMAAAVSSVANRGELLEPRIVRAVVTDGRRAPVPRKVVRRTISANTAAVLTEIMEQVVERGTGKNARIDGFTVAGKTGTAQKVVNGQYSRSDYNASFVGFVPSRQPKFVIVVVIDSPHGRNSYYGSTVAAPIFQRIGAAALRLYGVPPSLNPAPPLIAGGGKRLLQTPWPRPTGPAVIPVGTNPLASPMTVPDLRGLGARDAVQILAKLGMSSRLLGAGVVVDQDPLPGSPIEHGAVSVLRLARQATADVAAPATGGQ
jgi:membrane peptidoglycan carboxypeptidase